MHHGAWQGKVLLHILSITSGGRRGAGGWGSYVGMDEGFPGLFPAVL